MGEAPRIRALGLLGALQTVDDGSVGRRHPSRVSVGRPRPEDRRVLAIVFALIVVAAVLRFATLDLQSFWLDEVVTVRIVQGPFHSLLHSVAHSESTPPLFYVLGWCWAKLFGTGEIGMRSLSALAGTLTVPVTYATGRRLFSTRTAVIAAAIVAVHPMLIWYSQEARAYALLALLGTLALLFFVRSAAEPSRANLTGWAASSSLALATHYFAVFPLIAEAGFLLLFARRRRPILLAAAAPVAMGLLLLPLAIRQRGAGLASWIAGIPLAGRLDDTAAQFIFGRSVQHIRPIAAGLLVVLAAAAFLGVERKERRALTLPLLVAVATLLPPLALVPFGLDLYLWRNVIVALPALALVVAATLASRRAERLGIAAGIVVSLLLLAMTFDVFMTPSLQRSDWRAAAHSLGPVGGQRVVILRVAHGRLPFELYRPDARTLTNRGIHTREIDIIGTGPGLASLDAPAGFYRIRGRAFANLTVVRLRAAHPVRVRPNVAPGSPVYVDP
jgi:mannosyltransferase